MSNQVGSRSTRIKYDLVINLLLIGDSGKLINRNDSVDLTYFIL